MPQLSNEQFPQYTIEQSTAEAEPINQIELLQEVLNSQPKSLEQAQQIVSLTQTANEHLKVNGSRKGPVYRLDGELVGAGFGKRIRTVANQGLRVWTLDAKEKIASKNIAEGQRPDGTSFKAWYETPLTERTALKNEARDKLRLSEEIETHLKTKTAEAKESAKAEKLQKELDRVAQEVADIESARLSSGRDAFIQAKLARSQTTGGQREMLTENLGKRYDEDIRIMADAKGKEAAEARRAFIEANGGVEAIDGIRKQEIEAAEKESFLRRLHGSDYDNYMARRAANKQESEDKASLENSESVLPVPDGVDQAKWSEISSTEQLLIWQELEKQTPNFSTKPDNIPQADWDGLKPWERKEITRLLNEDLAKKTLVLTPFEERIRTTRFADLSAEDKANVNLIRSGAIKPSEVEKPLVSAEQSANPIVVPESAVTPAEPDTAPLAPAIPLHGDIKSNPFMTEQDKAEWERIVAADKNHGRGPAKNETVKTRRARVAEKITKASANMIEVTFDNLDAIARRRKAARAKIGTMLQKITPVVYSGENLVNLKRLERIQHEAENLQSPDRIATLKSQASELSKDDDQLAA